MNKKIAIFGGSFNPPHIGHKKIIEIIQKYFPCDEIWLLPSGQRKDKVINARNTDRVALLDLLIKELEKESGPKIRISETEINKDKATSTIETLEELEKEYPNNEFHFVISTELVPDIKTFWVKGEEIFERANFIIIERPGYMRIEEIELPPHSTVIKQLEVIPQISSTKIREINNPNDLYEWLDTKLADYIINNNLYGFKK
jgi:nicotinate-nucleotide adenylyltransferase